MSRTILIDGYNLLLQIPELAHPSTLSLEERRERLLNKLVILTAGKRLKLRVVFDGARGGSHPQKVAELEVVFAPPPADGYIRRQITQHEGQREFVVVSSDRKDIGEFAKASGVTWITSAEFWAGLTAAAERSKSSQGGEGEHRDAPPGWTAKDDEELRKRFESE